jgi:hypothetical protein
MRGAAGRYTPPCGYILVQTSSGVLPVALGCDAEARGFSGASVQEIKEHVERATGLGPLVQAIFPEGGGRELLGSDLVAAGTTLHLVAPAALSAAPRRRKPTAAGRRAARHAAADSDAATRQAALGRTFAVQHAATWRSAQQVLERFQAFADEKGLPVDALLEHIATFTRLALRSVALRSQAVPRLQAALRQARRRLLFQEHLARVTLLGTARRAALCRKYRETPRAAALLSAAWRRRVARGDHVAVLRKCLEAQKAAEKSVERARSLRDASELSRLSSQLAPLLARLADPALGAVSTAVRGLFAAMSEADACEAALKEAQEAVRGLTALDAEVLACRDKCREAAVRALEHFVEQCAPKTLT